MPTQDPTRSPTTQVQRAPGETRTDQEIRAENEYRAREKEIKDRIAELQAKKGRRDFTTSDMMELNQLLATDFDALKRDAFSDVHDAIGSERKTYASSGGGNSSSYFPSLEALNPDLTPVNMDPSLLYSRPAGADVYADPESIKAQQRALQGLEQMGRGNLLPGEIMGMEIAQARAAQAERSQREAMERQMAQRGMWGSGAQLAGSMASAQAGNNSMREAQLAQMMAASQRALGATSAAGNLSSGMRGQGFDEAAQRAKYLDVYNMGNADIRREAAYKHQQQAIAAQQQRYDNDLRRIALRAGLPPATYQPSYGDQALAGGIQDLANYGATWATQQAAEEARQGKPKPANNTDPSQPKGTV